MARRATSKPVERSDSRTVDATEPLTNGPTDAPVPPAIEPPSSGVSAPLVDEVAPVEVFGDLTPQVPSSPVVTDAAGNSYVEGDLDNKDIVSSNNPQAGASAGGAVTSIDQAPSHGSQQQAESVQSSPPVQGGDSKPVGQSDSETAPDALADNPAIELAQTFITPHGIPNSPGAGYHLPEPFDVFAKKKAK